MSSHIKPQPPSHPPPQSKCPQPTSPPSPSSLKLRPPPPPNLKPPISNPTKSTIQAKLRKETGGTPQRCIYGVVDIVSKTEIIQIAEWKMFTEAFSDIIFNKTQFPDKTPRVHFYGEKIEDPAIVNKILSTMKKYGITVTDE